MREQIEKRIEELKTARDQFVTQANQQIAALNGGIAELEALLKVEEARCDFEADLSPCLLNAEHEGPHRTNAS